MCTIQLRTDVRHYNSANCVKYMFPEKSGEMMGSFGGRGVQKFGWQFNDLQDFQRVGYIIHLYPTSEILRWKHVASTRLHEKKV